MENSATRQAINRGGGILDNQSCNFINNKSRLKTQKCFTITNEQLCSRPSYDIFKISSPGTSVIIGLKPSHTNSRLAVFPLATSILLVSGRIDNRLFLNTPMS